MSTEPAQPVSDDRTPSLQLQRLVDVIDLDTEVITQVRQGLRRNVKWDLRMLALARHVASWSKDPSTQVGAVLVDFHKTGPVPFRLRSVGFNGFPRSLPDNPELLENREEKYKRVVHAEINALLNTSEPRGYIHYQDTIPTLYTWPFMSCVACMPVMLAAGIVHFVSMWPTDDIFARWGESVVDAATLVKEAADNNRAFGLARPSIRLYHDLDEVMRTLP